MRIEIATFAGTVPHVDASLLPTEAAVRAIDTWIETGTLRPRRQAVERHFFEDVATSFFLHRGEWIGFEFFSHVVPGATPGTEDRLYIASDTSPPVVRYGKAVTAQSFPLALPAPTIAPTVAGGAIPSGATVVETTLFAYTWVTVLSEESGPSPVSEGIDLTGSQPATLSGWGTPPPGRGVDRIRVYRSATGATGATELHFVAEIALPLDPEAERDVINPDTGATLTRRDYNAAEYEPIPDYEHRILDAPIQEVLPTEDHSPAPDDLRGIVSMPGGVIAGFDGKELLFCEPYLPHAWPIKYRLRTNHDIVGLASFGSFLAVMTQGEPYIVQGTDPATFSFEKVEQNMPCLSGRGIVDLGYASAYPSPDGLVVIGQQGAEIVTKDLFTREQWQRLNPSTFSAALFDGRYVFSFDPDETSATTVGTVFDPFAVAPVAVSMIPAEFADDDTAEQANVGSLIVGPRIGSINIAEGSRFFETARGTYDSLAFNVETGSLFALEARRSVVEWGAKDADHASVSWVSKPFDSEIPVNFGAIMVRARRLPGATLDPVITVIADGETVATFSTINRIKRLPAGFLANQWQITLGGPVEFTSVIMGATPQDIGV